MIKYEQELVKGNPAALKLKDLIENREHNYTIWDNGEIQVDILSVQSKYLASIKNLCDYDIELAFDNDEEEQYGLYIEAHSGQYLLNNHPEPKDVLLAFMLNRVSLYSN